MADTDRSTNPALPEGPSDEVKAAFARLELDHESATLDDVEAAFDNKVPEFHPATGGSDEAFTKLKIARQTARVYLL